MPVGKEKRTGWVSAQRCVRNSENEHPQDKGRVPAEEQSERGVRKRYAIRTGRRNQGNWKSRG